MAERVHLKERTIRRLTHAGDLDSVRIGARDFIPVDAWGDLIERKRKKAWHDEIKVQSSDSLKIVESTTSPGQSTVAAASARLARQTASKLRSSSRNGCMEERGDGPSDPAEILVTRSSEYRESAPKVIGQGMVARAVEKLTRLWQGRTVVEVPAHVDAYMTRREGGLHTVRRELGVLQAAINYSSHVGRITRSVTVELPLA